MKETLKPLAIGLAAAALLAATSVQALPADWSSFWVTDFGAGTVDAVTGTISGGGAFVAPGTPTGFGATLYSGGYEAVEYPVVWNDPLPGWTSANGVNSASMTGPSQTGLFYYWINLGSDITQAFQIDQLFWSGGIVIDHVIISYDGSGALTPLDGQDRNWGNAGFTVSEAPVPDGGSALMLLGSSLAGLTFLRRRFGRC